VTRRTNRNPHITAATFVGLADDDKRVLLELIQQLNEKRTRNELRQRYYDGKNALKDLGISIPPQLRSVEVVVGWPAKAVDSMSRRTMLQGFTTTGGDELKAVVETIWDTNRMVSETPAAHTSALIQSCSFGFVHVGDESAGEPPVIVTYRNATDATGTWDRRRRALSNALSIVEIDRQTYQPTIMNLYMPGRVITLQRVQTGIFHVTNVAVHGMGVPVELLPYRADLDRPFGRSRISRAVMYNTDASVRTMLRTEVGAEFYNAPQRYALGADEEAFEDKNGNPIPAWTVMLGRLLTLSRDEDGQLPQVGQFAQQTMQPNLDQMRSIAQVFASETNLPVGALGIVQDNPSSAEAMQMAWADLGIDIEFWERTSLGPAHQRLMTRAVAMATDSGAALAEARTLRAKWGKWYEPSEVMAAQAALARVQAIPRLAETTIELERMGYDLDEIASIKAELSRSASRSNLQALLAAGAQDTARAAAAALTAPEAAPAAEAV
jgi:hypothetical protein